MPFFGAAVLCAVPLLTLAAPKTPASGLFDSSGPSAAVSGASVTASPQWTVNPAAPVEVTVGRSITVGKGVLIGKEVKPASDLMGMRASIPDALMHGVESSRAIAPNPAAPRQEVQGRSIIAPR